MLHYALGIPQRTIQDGLGWFRDDTIDNYLDKSLFSIQDIGGQNDRNNSDSHQRGVNSCPRNRSRGNNRSYRSQTKKEKKNKK
jgi:hypothetical protein